MDPLSLSHERPRRRPTAAKSPANVIDLSSRSTWLHDDVPPTTAGEGEDSLTDVPDQVDDVAAAVAVQEHALNVLRAQLRRLS